MNDEQKRLLREMVLGTIEIHIREGQWEAAMGVFEAFERDAREQGRREGLEDNRAALHHLCAGLEHIIADDDCERCKENVGQAQYLADFIGSILAAKPSTDDDGKGAG